LDIEWLEPWYELGPDDADRARGFERELPPGHPLAGIPLEAVGKRDDNDDVLLRLKDGSGRLAVVHLTWIGKPERPPWPATALFENDADWFERGLWPDHEEYASDG
jgi:hypothetical protein